MKSRPITLTADEVRGVLDGTLMQVRRAVKPQPTSTADRLCFDAAAGAWFPWIDATERIPGPSIRCPFGVPGDRLWCKETWAHYHTVNHLVHSGGRAFSEVSDGLAGYRADGCDTIDDFKRHIAMMGDGSLEDVLVKDDR